MLGYSPKGTQLFSLKLTLHPTAVVGPSLGTTDGKPAPQPSSKQAQLVVTLVALGQESSIWTWTWQNLLYIDIYIYNIFLHKHIICISILRSAQCVFASFVSVMKKHSTLHSPDLQKNHQNEVSKPSFQNEGLSSGKPSGDPPLWQCYLSNVQNPYGIPLYWLVHSDPYNGLS